MLSDHRERSLNGCCWLHKQTHTCERWVPELRSDLLLSLLCSWQSRVCKVLLVWKCLHCDSHVKVRLTETETERFWVHCQLRAIQSVLQAFVETAFTRVDVGVER